MHNSNMEGGGVVSKKMHSKSNGQGFFLFSLTRVGILFGLKEPQMSQ